MLTDAWSTANAKNSDENSPATVKLLNSVQITQSLTVEKYKYIVLDLNNCTIDRGLTSAIANGYVIKISGNFTLDDTSTEKTGTITGGNNSNSPSSSYVGGGILCEASGELVMKGGNISRNKSLYGGGVGLKGGSSFILEGGSISYNEIYSQGSGGGVYVQESTFEFKGGEICGNTAKSGGGGVLLAKSNGIMSGGKVINNFTEGDNGGGVYLNSSSFKMTGGEISLNKLTANGGGIYQYSQAPIEDFVLIGGTIKNNTCATAKNGGGVYVSGNFNVAGDIKIVGNVAGGTIESGVLSGGAANNVYLPKGVVVAISDKNASTSEDSFIGEMGVTMDTAGVITSGWLSSAGTASLPLIKAITVSSITLQMRKFWALMRRE